ncbi:MAG TPA: endo-1,4-beta-xylanase, partial [Stellaceae bacterium]|nr:endo-1,4-beta-xylanase [Stellaceae bacterium]
CGIAYGASSDIGMSEAPVAYRALFTEQCGLYAPNLSWATVTRGRGVYDFSTAQDNLNFAAARNMPLTGAHLLWHERHPRWLNEITEPSDLRAAMIEHIVAMGARFAGRVRAWNVVNEAIRPEDGRADGLRDDLLLRGLGLDYIDLAFHAAQAAAPKALLVYNDYGMELDQPNHAARRRALLALLDRLKRAGAPLGGIGLQSHLQVSEMPRFNERLYRDFLSEIASRGVAILITELDVLDIGAPADIAPRDTMVAEAYARFLNVALDERAVTSVVTWGLSDRYTWLTPQSGEKFGRADGLPTRPLPFDADFHAKPAFATVLAAVGRAARRA